MLYHKVRWRECGVPSNPFPVSAMQRRVRVPFGHPAVFSLLVSALLAACGDGKPAPDAASSTDAVIVSSCASARPSAEYVAFLDFIKNTSPAPQRFLTAAGTDSAAPEDGFRAMQDKGPSYFYGGDEAAKQKLKEKLASVGPYASLLIVFRGSTSSTNGDTVSFDLGGHYVGGEHDGKVGESRTMVVACADSAWKVTTETEFGRP